MAPSAAACLGLFGLGEVLVGAESASDHRILRALRKGRYGLREVMLTAADWARSRGAILRGTALGFVVGVLPGAGPTIASFLAYAVEKKASRHLEEFGHGAIEGVAGQESANNAAYAGAMVPMLTLGIPGSATTAVMLGGLMMWGLRPGPLLFEKNPDFVWGLIASLYIANVMLLVLNVGFIPMFVRALAIARSRRRGGPARRSSWRGSGAACPSSGPSTRTRQRRARRAARTRRSAPARPGPRRATA